MDKWGHIRIKLADLMEAEGMSKNKLCHRAEMERTQLNNYYNGSITRLDIDVLSRLCTALHCEIGELLEFVPPEEEEEAE